MTENKSLYQAFKYLKRYEEYRFVKAWGIMMIVIGATSIITAFLYGFLPVIPPSDPFAFMRTITRTTQLKLLRGQIINLIMFCPIILSFFIALYLFFTVKRTRLTDTTEIKRQKYAYFGLALFLMSFLPLYVYALLEVYYPIFSFFGITSSYCSYVLLKRVQKSSDFRELMNFCVVLIIFTLPGIAISLIELWMNQRLFLWDIVSNLVPTPENLKTIYGFSRFCYYFVFTIGCFVFGASSIQNSFKILKDDNRIHN